MTWSKRQKADTARVNARCDAEGKKENSDDVNDIQMDKPAKGRRPISAHEGEGL